MEHYYAFQARRMQTLLAQKGQADQVKAAAKKMIQNTKKW
jgi:hypothetical protein